jgi:hypothetical protein
MVAMEKETACMRKIIITGPESTGKSQLSLALANHFSAPMVPEIARTYLEEHGLDYSYADVESIAKLQQQAITNASRNAANWLFCDTDLLVIKIWMDYKYGEHPAWITDALEQEKPDFCLLCNIDLPWEEDPMREHPHERKILFDIYEASLKRLNYPYAVISGMGEDRLAQALQVLKKEFPQ